MTRRRLLNELDAAELVEWEEYWKREPFGDEWRGLGRVCETVAMSGGVKKKNGQRLTEEDFMPAGYLRPKPRVDSADSVEANLMGWATATNAAAKKAKKKK